MCATVNRFDRLLQTMHLLMILVIARVVFGPKKVPELGRGLGEGIRGFKAGVKGEEKTGGATLYADIAPKQ